MKRGFGKRGISPVVTMALLVGITLVVATIAWVLISNLIDEDLDESSTGRVLVGLNIERVRVEGEIMKVTVKRRLGKGDLIGMNLVLEAQGESFVVENRTALDELEKNIFIINLTEVVFNGADVEKVSVAPVVASSAGKELVGQEVDSYDVVQDSGGNSGGAPA
jgi:flagellin-like protein